MVPVVVGRDVDACRAHVKPRLALYMGGMGARGRNFYFDLACRYGYEADAVRLQELYLAGRRPRPRRRSPTRWSTRSRSAARRERIRERLALWRDAGVTTLICATSQPEAIRLMAELVL